MTTSDKKNAFDTFVKEYNEMLHRGLQFRKEPFWGDRQVHSIQDIFDTRGKRMDPIAEKTLTNLQWVTRDKDKLVPTLNAPEELREGLAQYYQHIELMNELRQAFTRHAGMPGSAFQIFEFKNPTIETVFMNLKEEATPGSPAAKTLEELKNKEQTLFESLNSEQKGIKA